jgi:hypothetical protein
MGQLRPYSQRVLDATQAIARMLTLAVFLSIGISNYAVFGSKIQVTSMAWGWLVGSVLRGAAARASAGCSEEAGVLWGDGLGVGSWE